MNARVPIAIVGVGKIARDQHVPSLAASEQFELVATVSHHGGVDGIPVFTTIGEMAGAGLDIRAVSICTQPRGRLALVRDALDCGYAVMLEKPPAATLSEAEAIAAAALAAGRPLFATWHSREAAAVEPARRWLVGRLLDRVMVEWKENVRVWHPGQEWIWEPGIGVFDPGINALSILTRLLPAPLLLNAAELSFPEDRAAPIAAALEFVDGKGTPVVADFDFDQRGPQSWDIAIRSGSDELRLSQGGSRLHLNGVEQPLEAAGEYPQLYRRFAALLESGESEVDLAPFRLVADAYTLGRRRLVGPFSWSD